MSGSDHRKRVVARDVLRTIVERWLSSSYPKAIAERQTQASSERDSIERGSRIVIRWRSQRCDRHRHPKRRPKGRSLRFRRKRDT